MRFFFLIAPLCLAFYDSLLSDFCLSFLCVSFLPTFSSEHSVTCIMCFSTKEICSLPSVLRDFYDLPLFFYLLRYKHRIFVHLLPDSRVRWLFEICRQSQNTILSARGFRHRRVKWARYKKKLFSRPEGGEIRC